MIRRDGPKLSRLFAFPRSRSNAVRVEEDFECECVRRCTMALKLISGQFPTRIISSREVAGFVLTETTYSPNQRLSKHCHEHVNFVIVVRGGFTEHVGRTTRRCEPSSVIFRPPGELHADDFHNAGGRCLTIEVAEQWLKSTPEPEVIIRDPAVVQNALLTTISSRLYAEFRRLDNISALAIEGLIFEMIAEVSRLSIKQRVSSPRCRIENAREIIHSQFSTNITLRFLADSIGAHPVYLAREFRNRYHCTIGDYIRNLRIQFACRELAQSDATIAQIASTSGFFDQSHFTRTFKQLIGTTPTKYRKNIRSH